MKSSLYRYPTSQQLYKKRKKWISDIMFFKGKKSCLRSSYHELWCMEETLLRPGVHMRVDRVVLSYLLTSRLVVAYHTSLSDRLNCPKIHSFLYSLMVSPLIFLLSLSLLLLLMRLVKSVGFLRKIMTNVN